MYADYAFYTETFYGTAITEEDFPRLSSRASDFIDYYTKGKAAKVVKLEELDEEPKITPQIKKACCAIAEQMQLDEQQKQLAALVVSKAYAAASGENPGTPERELRSESIGGWSGSYVTAADYMQQSAADAQKAARAAYAQIAFEYLANTGLLYRGGRC